MFKPGELILAAKRVALGGFGGLWGGIAVVTALASGVFFFVPWAPPVLARVPCDAAYTRMAHQQFAAGVPWSVSTAHTSGPWGFVRFAVFAPETLKLNILVHGALGVVLGVIIFGILVNARIPPLLAALVTIVQLWLLAQTDDSAWFYLLLAQLYVLPDFRRHKTSSLLVLATLTSAFAATVKGTFLVIALAVQGVILLLELWARRWPVNTGLWLLGLCGFLAAARVGPNSWFHHMRHVLGSLPAYDESFSLTGPPSQASAFAALSGLLLIPLLWFEPRSLGKRGVLTIFAYSAVLFVMYKTAVVRPDPMHLGRTFYSLAAFWCTLAFAQGAALRRVLQMRFGSRWLAWAGLTASIAPIAGALYWLNGTFEPETTTSKLVGLARAVSEVLDHGFERTRRVDEQIQSLLRSRYRLPAEVGQQLGVFGTFQSPVIAYGRRNVPLPVAAHYEVWTHETIAATNRFLSSDAAPEYLLQTATNQSASNAVTLAQYYEQRGEYRTFALLRKRRVPLISSWRRVLERDVSWDEIITIPTELQSRVLVAKLRYDRTLINRVITFAYQPPRVYLVLYADAIPYAKVRLNRLILDDGVVLAASRGTWDAKTNGLHYRRHPVLTRAQSHFSGFAITAESPLGVPQANGYFSRRVHVQLEEVSFPPGALSAAE